MDVTGHVEDTSEARRLRQRGCDVIGEQKLPIVPSCRGCDYRLTVGPPVPGTLCRAADRFIPGGVITPGWCPLRISCPTTAVQQQKGV